jgi:heptosyltransferase III
MRLLKRKYSGTPREVIPLKIMDFFVDTYAAWFYRRRPATASDPEAPRILLVSLGHLGDALTFTYLFPLIRERYPLARLHVVVPSWCRAVLEPNPYPEQLVYLDHYQTNRQSVSLWQKLKINYHSWRAALASLKPYTFDYYLDVRYTDAVGHALLPFLNVKRAYGFARRGLGGLLTREFAIPDRQFHHAEMYLLLLRELGIEARPADLHPYFEPGPAHLPPGLPPGLPPAGPYCLLFPEAGTPDRQLPLLLYVQLVRHLLAHSPLQVLVCGQHGYGREISAALEPQAQGRVTDVIVPIPALAHLARNAAFAFTLDSFPVHFCTIFCPTLAVYYHSNPAFLPLANHPVRVVYIHQEAPQVPYDRQKVQLQYFPQLSEAALEQVLTENLNFFLASLD